MPQISFADVAHQSISLSTENSSHAVVLDLIDTPWVQRLRDISQTANTRLVYMFSEHSRFGHCLGVAHLALLVMEKLKLHYADQVEGYSVSVSAAALLHDIGHLAPGSHTAFKTWFPEQPDTHEDISARILRSDPSITSILNKYGDHVLQNVLDILGESSRLPAWTWEIISGGGWNVDRGNWCLVDSILAGVSYGKYNIPALTESIVITPQGHLALNENRLDAMMHFAVSRHAMYRQIYQHRVILATDTLNQAIAQRARDLGMNLEFADEAMRIVLSAKSPAELSLETIDIMREPWWRYHLLRWRKSSDAILSDLSSRLLGRNLFKTVRIQEGESMEELHAKAKEAVIQAGYDPRYYLHSVSMTDTNLGDSNQSMQVLLDDGRIRSLADADPLFKSMIRESGAQQKQWLVLPATAKVALGRKR